MWVNFVFGFFVCLFCFPVLRCSDQMPNLLQNVPTKNSDDSGVVYVVFVCKSTPYN